MACGEIQSSIQAQAAVGFGRIRETGCAVVGQARVWLIARG
jgi:hypothetical protein